MSKGKKWFLGIFAGVVVIAVIASIAGGSSDDKKGTPSANQDGGDPGTPTAPAAPAKPVHPRVHGDVSKSILASGDDEALSRVRFAKVYCQWNDDGSEVTVHVLVKNPMAAHITVHLSPSYSLVNAGKHGDGIDDYKDIGVNAKEWRDWSTTLGSPSGVDGTPAISACEPELEGIDLG